MKNPIKLTVLLLLTSFNLFAGKPVETAASAKEHIQLQALHAPFSVGVSIQNAIEGNASVEITDQQNHILLMDKFSKKSVQRAYNLAELEPGDYTFTIHSNTNAVTKRVHIYEASGEKTWFIFE